MANLHSKSYNAQNEQNDNIIGSVLLRLRKSKNYSQEQMCAELKKYGVTIGAAGLGKWERGLSIPTAYQVIAACHALDHSLDMSEFISDYVPLLNEEGQRKVDEYVSDLAASGKYAPTQAQSNIIEYITLPHSNLKAAAGTGSFLDEGNFEYRDYPANYVPKGAKFSVEITGDSMEPIYHDKQIAFVAPCKTLRVGEVGLFTYDGLGFIKVYGEQMPSPDDADDYTDAYGVIHPQPVLISLNNKYPPRPISPNVPFQIVGKIL